MAELASSFESRRPAVQVLTVQAASIDLQPVFWGLEEEGIPFEVRESPHGRAVALAKEAAQMSPLNVGIAVSGSEQTIALHHRDLPADQPLFTLRLQGNERQHLRRLGINAARLVKAEPLVLNDEPSNEAPQSTRRSASISDEMVERMVQAVLAELAKTRGRSWKKTVLA